MQPTETEIPYLLAGRFYRLALTCWGDAANKPVVCVHGLSRQGRDFDELARALADRFYVVCPDLPGRGRSEWLAEPGLYAPPNYVVALGHVLAHLSRPVLWVGTSLGGICGMLLAAAPGAPIERMVLNDIGPFLPKAALGRIADYVSDIPTFDDMAGLEAHLRRVHATFGPLTDAQWGHLARHSGRTLPDGRVTLHFDPAMTIPLTASKPVDLDLWPVWEAIRAPMLTLRGETSDLLLPDTLVRMGGKSQTHVVAETGHAPALMDTPTIGVVTRFLDGLPPDGG
jgi:pimeloyl-ACP methyl ester carboxylesterase